MIMVAPSPSIRRPQPGNNRPIRTAARRAHHPRPSPDLFQWAGVIAPRRNIALPFDPRKSVKFAVGIWNASFDAGHAILAERWAASQGMHLPDDCGSVVRFHPNLKYGNVRAPGLIWLLRDLHDDAPCGIIRYFLDEAGNVIGRRTLGRAYGSAIKLTDDAEVTTGLVVAPTIERGIAAMNAELRPVWVVSALADFPVLSGVEALTIIATPDDTDAQVVAARWRAANREVHIMQTPPPGEPDGGAISVDQS